MSARHPKRRSTSRLRRLVAVTAAAASLLLVALLAPTQPAQAATSFPVWFTYDRDTGQVGMRRYSAQLGGFIGTGAPAADVGSNWTHMTVTAIGPALVVLYDADDGSGLVLEATDSSLTEVQRFAPGELPVGVTMVYDFSSRENVIFYRSSDDLEEYYSISSGRLEHNPWISPENVLAWAWSESMTGYHLGPNWTHIARVGPRGRDVPGVYGFFLYDAATGAASIEQDIEAYFWGFPVPRRYPAGSFATGWTSVSYVPDDGRLYFHNAATGSFAFGTVEKDQRNTFQFAQMRSTTNFLVGSTIAIPTDNQLAFYNPAAGGLTLFTPNWTSFRLSTKRYGGFPAGLEALAYRKGA